MREMLSFYACYWVACSSPADAILESFQYHSSPFPCGHPLRCGLAGLNTPDTFSAMLYLQCTLVDIN